MSKTCGYIRVSTDEQGLSVEAQKEALTRFAGGLELFTDEGVSGAIPLGDRPQGKLLLAKLQARRKKEERMTLVVTKLDRLYRSILDCVQSLEALNRAAVDLVILDFGGSIVDTRSPMGKIFLLMSAGFAEIERKAISARTKAALAHKRSRGELTGSAPYGMRVVDRAGKRLLEACPQEQAVIQRIRALRAQGITQDGIVTVLAQEGMVSRSGLPLGRTQVARILKG